MARIQILELPAGVSDDRPPFVLIVDETATGPDGKPIIEAADFVEAREQIGARDVFIFEETVDIPANGADLAPALLFRADDNALTEMTRSRDEWQQRSIRTEEILERVRGGQHQAKVDLGVALGVSRLGGWDDIVNAARRLRKERDQQRAALDAVAELHRRGEHRGQIICRECSGWDGDEHGSTDNAPVAWPCDTIKALDVAPSDSAPEGPGRP